MCILMLGVYVHTKLRLLQIVLQFSIPTANGPGVLLQPMHLMVVNLNNLNNIVKDATKGISARYFLLLFHYMSYQSAKTYAVLES